MKKNFFPTCTLCDTTFTDYDYNDYVDFCEMNDCEPQGEGSNDFYDWIIGCREVDYEGFITNLECSKINETPCLVIGSCGTWRGRIEIVPYRFENILSAVRKCESNCDDIKITLENGIIHVSAYHHDGTNCFEIHKLSKKGLKVTEKWYDGIGDGEVKDYWLAKWHDYLF